MSKKPRLYDVVEIDWLDSQQISLGWERPSEYVKAVKRPQSYRTVGYWLGSHAGQVLVCLSTDSANGHVTQGATIPMSCVVKLRVLDRASKATRETLRG